MLLITKSLMVLLFMLFAIIGTSELLDITYERAAISILAAIVATLLVLGVGGN
ncbi:hypothetical protein J2S08_000255 [Bacillus chungangensis]|uniref:Uncharacterized protein n=1 Tax=Bacillus chungangensis TaxID=587633 RepID=A0ABT9WMU5_9BACI|nr:hypothetical protein [Bacillus chungangensis]